MKKFYTSALALALLSGTAFSQQLPNADFEGTWNKCTPWTGGYGSIEVGENPADWCISHVMGITVKEALFIPAGTGKKAMGENVAGYNGSNSAVKLTNGETGAMGITRVVPGYLTLGTTWSTAKGTEKATHDGGTWGGIDFSYRPDGFEFMYKREYDKADATDEAASFIMYLWKGSASQASVPVTITAGTNKPSTTTMENRDRNILYKDEATTTGDAITYSEDFELIAKAIITEAGAVNDWTKKTVELQYLSTAAPSMANIILAANDYFSTVEATTGNSLTVDDIRLLYYSRLASINVNGVAIEDFDSNTFYYDLTDTEYPGEGGVEVSCLGNSGSAISDIAYDEDNCRVVITVTNSNEGGTDVDGEATHTYTIQFAAPKATGLTFRRKYTDSSVRYYNEISYIVGEETKTAYYTENPQAEPYFVTPQQNVWEEGGAYIDLKESVIEIPADAENFTMILKGLSGTAINWSQSCVYVDWNANGSYIDEGETNGVINLGIKPNQAGGGMVMTETGDRDVITLPEGLNEGDTFSMLICLNEPKGLDGTDDKWGDNWEWSNLIFADGVCSVVNGQAYELTVKITKPAKEVTGRNVTVAVADGQDALGSVAIEGSEDLTVTTEDDVVVTATAADGAQFLGWYNGEELVSTEASYTVEGTEDVTLTANFGWTVTFTATNGKLSVMNGDTELTSGDAVRPGTVLTVTPTPNTNMEFESLTVNGNDVELTEGVASVTVNGVTEIEASFKAVMVTYTQSCTGNGKVEAWTKYDTNNDDAPAGDLIPDGSEVAMGSAINIYIIPGQYGDSERETVTAILISNGDTNYTLDDKDSYIVAPKYDDKGLVLFTDVKGNFSVKVNFSDILAGITDVFFDGVEGDTEYFTIQGVKVAAENLETGFYIARRGNKTIKVYISK